MYDRPVPDGWQTVSDLLTAKATTNGDETAFQYQDRKASYSHLDQTTNAIANALASQGIGHGDRVCLFLYTSLEYLYAYFALAKLGAIAVPIDTRFDGPTLEFVLTETDADAIMLEARTRDAYESVRPNLDTGQLEYYVGDGTPDGPYRDFDALLEGDDSQRPSTDVSEADTFSITFVQRQAAEQPKGVMLPHFSYLNTGWEASQELFEFSGEDRLFTTLPLYSIFTVQLGVMGSLVSDATFVVVDRFDPTTFWRQVARYDVTVFLYLGRMLSVLANQGGSGIDVPNSVDRAVGHGFGFGNDEEIISEFEERFNITVLEGYGVTQAATLIAYNVPSDRRDGSVGKPVSYVDLEIVNGSGWAVPTGETGEIVVRPCLPNSMMQGYYNDPERTVADVRNQWIHTGDIGYVDDDGYLHFIANKHNSIYHGRIAGRISSLEIQTVIESSEAVKAAAVVGVTNERGGEDIKATVVPTENIELSPVDVCRHCERQLPYLMVPRFVEIRESLPTTPTGKVQLATLKDDGIRDVWDREAGYDLSR